MRALQVGAAVAVVAVVSAAAWLHSNGGTFGDPPAEVHYHGCNYSFREDALSLEEAVQIEHRAGHYASTPVTELGRTPAGRPFYGLAIGDGDAACSRSPLEIYVRLGSGTVEQYRRGGGP